MVFWFFFPFYRYTKFFIFYILKDQVSLLFFLFTSLKLNGNDSWSSKQLRFSLSVISIFYLRHLLLSLCSSKCSVLFVLADSVRADNNPLSEVSCGLYYKLWYLIVNFQESYSRFKFKSQNWNSIKHRSFGELLYSHISSNFLDIFLDLNC